MKPLHGSIASMALVLLLTNAAAAFALIDGGQMEFNYASFPTGPHAGAFRADGPLLTGVPAVGGGAAAALFEFEGTHFAVVLAGLIDGDGNVDGAVIFMQRATPFTQGVYPVDPVGGSTLFAFADDAAAFAIPADPSATDWQAWFNELVAANKFVGASGAITLTQVGPTKIIGTFSGLALEVGSHAPISVSNGSFSVVGGSLPVEESSWAETKAAYHD